MDEKLSHEIHNHFEKDSNCQVFNGPVSGCVFAMPGATVNQSPMQKVDADKPEKRQQLVSDTLEQNEELFHFIHPELDDEETRRIHDAVKRVVVHQKAKEICLYLKELQKERKVLLPESPSIAYKELVRMGMPTGEGYSEKHFSNSYTK